MRYFLGACVIAASTVFGADTQSFDLNVEVPQSAFIAIIDQGHMAGNLEQLSNNPNNFIALFEAARQSIVGGAVRDLLNTFVEELGKGLVDSTNRTEFIIDSWDRTRELILRNDAEGKYDAIITVTGAQSRDPDLMRAIWQSAAEKYKKHIDFAFLTHAGHLFIEESWNLPKNLLRFGYISCGGTPNFITRHGALGMVGHQNVVASPAPLIDFTLLRAWFSGVSINDAVSTARAYGKNLLLTQAGFGLAQLVGNFQSLEQVRANGAMSIALVEGINSQNFNIDTSNITSRTMSAPTLTVVND